MRLFSGTVVTMVSCHRAPGFFLRRTDARPSMLHSRDPGKLGHLNARRLLDKSGVHVHNAVIYMLNGYAYLFKLINKVIVFHNVLHQGSK